MFIFLTIATPPVGGRTRPAGQLGAALWLGVVLVLTLRPDPAAAPLVAESPWYCLSCGEAGSADFLLNLLLLAPMGVALFAGAQPFRTAVWLVAGCSLAIEVTQGLAIPGRDAALGDVVANTLGGGAGWIAAWQLARGVPALVTPLILGAFAAQLLAAAWLSAPATSPAEDAAIRIAPVVPERQVYRGSVATLELDGRLVHGRRSTALVDTTATLTTAFTWSDHPGTTTIPVARAEDSRGWDIASVGQDATGITLSVRTRGGAWRLRTPTWHARLASAPKAGDTVAAQLRITKGSAELVSVAAGTSATAAVRHGAQHGWLLLHPWAPHAADDAAWGWWTAAWLAGWGVLLGVVAARRRPLRWGIAAVAVLAVATVVSGAPATALDYLALTLAFVAGVSSGSLLRPPASA